MTPSGGSDTTDDRRVSDHEERETLPAHEEYKRDHAFKRSIGCTVREGILWDEAWAAARSYYLARVGGERDAQS